MYIVGGWIMTVGKIRKSLMHTPIVLRKYGGRRSEHFNQLPGQ